MVVLKTILIFQEETHSTALFEKMEQLWILTYVNMPDN